MAVKTKRSVQWVKKKNKIKYVGLHLIVEFWYGKNIEDPKKLKKILIKAAKKANSLPLGTIAHKFSPHGLTGVVLLAESHIALHSWPEINYLAIDIFTCGDKSMPYKAFNCLKDEFKPKKFKIKEIKRGKI